MAILRNRGQRGGIAIRKIWICTFALIVSAGIMASLPSAADSGSAGPQFTSQGRLVRPQKYREWIYLSSGLGMEYRRSPAASPKFTNVFVTPAAYHAFLDSGKWPDKTMFVLEERASSSKGSINKAGHFQTNLEGLGVEVKDLQRFAGQWAYFSFGPGERTAAANPRHACWECHHQHGAVENTFVQFYPTLNPIARKFGTFQKKGN